MKHLKQLFLNATIDLLEETGYSALTIEAIATQMQVLERQPFIVGGANKAFLVLDAFFMTTDPHLYFLEKTSIRENFPATAYTISQKLLNGTLGRTVVALVAEGGEDSEIAKAFYTYLSDSSP